MEELAMLYFPDISDRMPRGPALVILYSLAACVALWYLTIGRFSWRAPRERASTKARPFIQRSIRLRLRVGSPLRDFAGVVGHHLASSHMTAGPKATAATTNAAATKSNHFRRRP